MVGLGNPGSEYARTRHNVGYRVLAVLRRRWLVETHRSAFGGRMDPARPQRPGAGERTVVLLEPHTYMNRSGQTVREAAAFYKAEPGDFLVVLDDMALPLGRVRARGGGSPGGHKGLGDVVSALGTQDVPRLRIGIGAAPSFMDGRDYVLAPFTDEENQVIEVAIETAADAVEDWLFRGLSFVMETYNRKPED